MAQTLGYSVDNLRQQSITQYRHDNMELGAALTYGSISLLFAPKRNIVWVFGDDGASRNVYHKSGELEGSTFYRYGQ